MVYVVQEREEDGGVERVGIFFSLELGWDVLKYSNSVEKGTRTWLMLGGMVVTMLRVESQGDASQDRGWILFCGG